MELSSFFCQFYLDGQCCCEKRSDKAVFTKIRNFSVENPEVPIFDRLNEDEGLGTNMD
jgi:hypothetical protein